MAPIPDLGDDDECYLCRCLKRTQLIRVKSTTQSRKEKHKTDKKSRDKQTSESSCRGHTYQCGTPASDYKRDEDGKAKLNQ